MRRSYQGDRRQDQGRPDEIKRLAIALRETHHPAFFLGHDIMTYGDLVSRVDFDMRRDSAFSYACHACNRCCRNKAIRVSPYEILRLARYLGLSTTEFIERHTEAGGTVLRTKENGDCGFLGERGGVRGASGSAPGLPDLSFGAMGLARRCGLRTNGGF